MFNPISTYRIQFHKGFTFQNFQAIIPYLQQLGVTTIYASPIFEAVPGSVHGYDCTNPLVINPEIGTLDELRAISKQLKEYGMGWLQDIVPNHMAYHHNNKWLMDVLENGEASEYAPFFDITWNSRNNEKLMVPFLGKTLNEVINDGELKVIIQDDKPMFDYYGACYPLSEASIKQFITADHDINNDKAALLQLAQSQHYRLCHWQETDNQINYRRFFTVNGLICVNIHNENVFNKHHSFIKQLVDEGIFQGLRIDHIDGLQNPTEYLHRLRKLAGDEVYITVEKILEPGEALPSYWPLQGSTGYDFLSDSNNLFTTKTAEKTFTDYYQNLTANYASIHQQLRDKKAHILSEHMNGELENLYRLFRSLNVVDKRATSGIPTDDLKSALGEFLIQCPVYRYYGSSFPLNNEEEAAIKKILSHLKKSGESKEAVAILETIFLHKPHEGNKELNNRIAQFYMRCMQFTGPLMAKGVEDTLMYTYNRFIGHNEVGDSPEAFGLHPQEFHQRMLRRQQQWPLSMSGTSTHDTKRGEDVRARLNVLTDLEDEWLAKVEEWRELNQDLKGDGAPDGNDEYLIYQALIGHYSTDDEDDFKDRVQEYLQKALREAKIHSNWTTPDEEYESATKAFAVALLNKERPFWKSFEEFIGKVYQHGMINSLSQVLLKTTLPGVPDVYQGCELWDLSFVDPDNRRAVDFEKRKAFLDSFENGGDDLLPTLWKESSGAIKLWLTQQMLAIRKTDAGLFSEGDYLPLKTEGKYKEHVFAFARKQGEKTYLLALPLHTATLCKEDSSFFKINWEDTRIVLPKEFGGFSDLLSGSSIAKSEGLLAKNLFKKFTVAILKGREAAKQRGAGILAHITSLPSHFGVGDLGPGAKSFADFLHRSGQKYWQLLPLNPTEEGQGYSPYSALSSKAGWPLLISPEALVKEGLLKPDELTVHHLPNESNVDYAVSGTEKEALLATAFEAFLAAPDSPLQKDFNQFCEKEKSWLDDFALFTFLKKEHKGLPWYEWPSELKMREEEALKTVRVNNGETIKKIKWNQFIFTKQWSSLKTYCNNRNIKLIGDMPFYVSYDSADVWADQELFALNEAGERSGIAGVPPDSFSADGQLWGMPTFNWERMKEDGYQWWIQRLRKNMELFDITRLDHFRAFEAYWKVPAGEETAKNGTWVQGPASDFFKAMQKEFGALPFVAEDLGDINEAVLNLRDESNLPGMKVLQFAFGDDMSQSDYIPHNYEKNFLVYTGTHDNNTTVGWWRTEADDSMKQRIIKYSGCDVDEKNVHMTLGRLAYSSVADIAILPVQDVLGLDETARMNVPSSANNNWAWRLVQGQLNGNVEKMLSEWVQLYNR